MVLHSPGPLDDPVIRRWKEGLLLVSAFGGFAISPVSRSSVVLDGRRRGDSAVVLSVLGTCPDCKICWMGVFWMSFCGVGESLEQEVSEVLEPSDEG